MRHTPFILLLVILCGCASYPRQMTGQFNARGDFIVIKRDGSLYWSPLSKTSDRLTFVGIGSSDKTDPLLVRLVVPSSSPFPYSSVRCIRVSNPYRQVWVGMAESVRCKIQRVFATIRRPSNGRKFSIYFGTAS